MTVAVAWENETMRDRAELTEIAWYRVIMPVLVEIEDEDSEHGLWALGELHRRGPGQAQTIAEELLSR